MISRKGRGKEETKRIGDPQSPSLDDGNKGFVPPFVPSFMPFFRDIPPLWRWEGGRECSTAVFADGIRTKKAMNKTTDDDDDDEDDDGSV